MSAAPAEIDKHGVGGLVVGLPLALEGGDSPRTQGVRDCRARRPQRQTHDEAADAVLVDLGHERADIVAKAGAADRGEAAIAARASSRKTPCRCLGAESVAALTF